MQELHHLKELSLGPRFVPMAAVRATSCLVLLTLACKPIGFSGSDPQKAKGVSAASGTGGAQSAAAPVAPATAGRLPVNPSLDECSARFMCPQGLTGAAPCGVSNGQGMRFILLPNKMSQYAGVIACKSKFNGNMVYVDQPYPPELTQCGPALGQTWGDFHKGSNGQLINPYFQNMNVAQVQAEEAQQCKNGAAMSLDDAFEGGGTSDSCVSSSRVICFVMTPGIP